MIKVGIVLMPNDNWLGGIHYYRNLIRAVNSLPDRQIEFVAITDTGRDVEQLKDFQCSEVVMTQLFKRYSFAWFIRKISAKLFKNDFLLSALLRKHNIAVLTHSGWLGKNAKIPTIGWIPDFQHRHLPNFFTKNELKVRNKTFLETCHLCTKVIVSSHDALKDLQQFSPESTSKAVVMQFAVPPKKQDTKLISLDELKSRYGFESSFFLLPNQFWAHKNHKVVIDALALLKMNNDKVTVLATGNTSDYRQPGFFETLVQQVEAKDVKDEFKILGMIPQSDLTALFIYANAIINPSLFEGWSTTVEEAKVLRKKIILSNIAIHKEQNPEFGYYFDPSNSQELALLLHQHAEPSALPNPDTNGTSMNAFINYGLTYQSIIKQVLDNK